MKRICLWVAAMVIAALLVPALSLAQDSSASDAAKSKASETAKPVVAVFRLNGALTETPTDDSFPFATEPTIALKDLVERLQKARDDKNVKVVAITINQVSLGFAQIEELRQALTQVREAGKEVYAHADSLSMTNYLLLAGATKLSMVPTGDLWLTGLNGSSLHVRGLLNKIGATPDFLTCGAYKSAAELFMRESPSKEADEMLNWLLDGLYDTSVKLIARGRGVSTDKAKQWIDGGPYTAKQAHEAGLIDAVQHRQEFEAGLKQRFDGNVKIDTKYGKKSQTQIDLSSPLGIFNFYAELLSGGKRPASTKEAIAIVYVEGPIVVGAPQPSPFDSGGGVAASTPIRNALNKAAEDDSIKAVVLRVNSPGGSATASEIILDATKRVKAKKPLVVSMGDVAGSGGYYVACGADTIFADESTITGSIGVVVGKLATTEMWNKIGINFKEYKRGANAGILSGARVFTPEEKKKIQSWMDEIYDVFKGHVKAIRGDRLKKPLDDIAGGRVYTGKQALDLGLVDKIGTLDDAVKYAASQAKIEKYELRVVPQPKNFIEQILESSSGGDDNEGRISMIALRGGDASLMHAALPYLRGLDPQRADAVVRAFLQLETLQREGVVLMMPEIEVR
jgi:protease IV